MKGAWPKPSLRCLIAIAAFSLLSACSSKPFAIEVQPLEEKTIYLEDRPELRTRCNDLNYEAFTEWFFHCAVKVDTETVRHDDNAGAATCTIQEKGVTVKLSCTVQVCISKAATAATKEHEAGHVAICRRVYAEALAVVEKLAQDLVGKTFYGMADTKEKARQDAIDKATAELAEGFRLGVTGLCDETSDRYDRYCLRYEKDKSWTVPALVEKALERSR